MDGRTELQVFIQDTVNQLANYSLCSILLSFHCNPQAWVETPSEALSRGRVPWHCCMERYIETTPLLLLKSFTWSTKNKLLNSAQIISPSGPGCCNSASCTINRHPLRVSPLGAPWPHLDVFSSISFHTVFLLFELLGKFKRGLENPVRNLPTPYPRKS